MITTRGYVSGLRWSGIRGLLFEAAVDQQVNLKILDEAKGLLRTTIYYELKGDEQAVRRCTKVIKVSIAEFNKDI